MFYTRRPPISNFGFSVFLKKEFKAKRVVHPDICLRPLTPPDYLPTVKSLSPRGTVTLITVLWSSRHDPVQVDETLLL